MVSTQAVISIEWTFLALAYIFVSARIYVRKSLRKDKFNWSDGWLVVGLVSVQGLVICDTITYDMGAMTDFGDGTRALGKIRFATNYFFDVGIFFPKFSVIALYYALVPPSKIKTRAALHILAGITVSAFLFTFFADTFWCGLDMSTNWDGDSSTCSTFTSMQLMRANWALNFLTEFLNVVFPFPLLLDLKLSMRRERISLAIIFGMSFITLGVSVGRFITMAYIGNATAIYILCTVEFCVSLIIVSMLVLRPLLKKLTGIMMTGFSAGYVASDSSPSNQSTKSSQKHFMSPALNLYKRNNDSVYHSHVTASPHDDMSGSEVELNSVRPGFIRKTEEVSIASETISMDDHEREPVAEMEL